MALWDDVEPCNFVFVIRLRGRADVARLQSAIQETCQAAGVGNLVLDRTERRYRYEPAGSIDLHQIDPGESALETFRQTVAEGLTTSFPRGPHHPVRWNVLDDPETGSHVLLAFVHHVATDAASIRLLVRRLLNRYYGARSPGDDAPLRIHPPNNDRLMRGHHRRLGYFTTFVRAVRLYFQLRHVHRIPDADETGRRLQFYVFAAPDGLIGRLTTACRRQRLTVTGAFLAALASALAEITPDRLRHPRRRGLVLANVASLRAEASEDVSTCFGVYLGQSLMVIEAPDLADFGRLVPRIAETMRRESTEKRFAAFPWNFLILTLLERWFSWKATRAWYRKVYPVSALLSSVRFDTPEFGAVDEHVLDCLAAASLGPAVPLVWVATTLRGRLSLSVIYRESVFTRAEVGRLAEIFLARLEALAEGGGAAAGAWRSPARSG